MDQNVGRVISDLRAADELANTLIIFLSDNGACAEWDPWGFDIKSSPQNILHRGDELEDMGGPGTFHSAGSGWAGASNTPWRLYKHYNHEGGINSPCIIHWPDGLRRRGDIDHTPTHIIDLMPTIANVAAAEHRGPHELPGKSIVPLFSADQMSSRYLFFEHEGNRAVTDGRWKLVATRGQSWELYDTASDRTELQNLAATQPRRVEQLSQVWRQWAERNNVTPLPNDYNVLYLRVE
jgi:arylsulfatase A-like enzyme